VIAGRPARSSACTWSTRWPADRAGPPGRAGAPGRRLADPAGVVDLQAVVIRRPAYLVELVATASRRCRSAGLRQVERMRLVNTHWPAARAGPPGRPGAPRGRRPRTPSSWCGVVDGLRRSARHGRRAGRGDQQPACLVELVRLVGSLHSVALMNADAGQGACSWALALSGGRRGPPSRPKNADLVTATHADAMHQA
jgi:hypothetical protein